MKGVMEERRGERVRRRTEEELDFNGGVRWRVIYSSVFRGKRGRKETNKRTNKI
jgi:hypothetical protein